MTLITASTNPLYWAAPSGANILETGVTHVGEATGSGLTLISDSSENTFLGKVVGKAGTYKPLPAPGAPLIAGEIYAYNGGLVIVRQSHTRTFDAPETVPALFSVYRSGASGALDWIANEQVYVGTLRLYAGITYICLQAHTTQVDWTPPLTPALWQVYVVVAGNVWAAGVAYKVNDQTTYLLRLYKCLQTHTSQIGWEPPNVPALWQDIGTAP